MGDVELDRLSENELERLDIDLHRVGDALRAARKATEAAYAEAERAALAGLKAGFTEVGVADSLGVDRMTVRKWQGKR